MFALVSFKQCSANGVEAYTKKSATMSSVGTDDFFEYTCMSISASGARLQPSMATPTEEDTCPKVLIRGEWRKVPDSYLADASDQLERDQLFINDVSKQLVAELHAACEFNPNPGAKPKSGDTKTDLIYKRAFCNYL